MASKWDNQVIDLAIKMDGAAIVNLQLMKRLRWD
jgi:hypothetical protein